MTDPRMSELFAQRPVTSDFARRGGVPYAVRRVITIIVLLGVIGGGASAAFLARHGGNGGEIPTIKAVGVYKQKPQEPGGIDIPHQDVQVYQEMDPKAAAVVQVEHLLPPAEEPMPSSLASSEKPANPSENKEHLIQSAAKAEGQDPAPATHVAAASTPDVQAIPEEPASAPPLTVSGSGAQRSGYMQMEQASAPPSSAVTPSTAPLKAAQTTIPATPEQPRVVTTESKKAAKASKMVRIQLAALPDKEAAEAHARHLQSKYDKQLGDIHLHLHKADLGRKGIYFRIQSQLIAEEEANRVCSILRSVKMSCLLVRQ